MTRNEQTHSTQTYDDLWEPFNGRPFAGNGVARIRVTMDKRRALFLNKAAYRALGEPRAVEFLFSKKLNAIGLVPSDLRSESSFPVKARKKGDGTPYGYEIRAAAFMHHHNFAPVDCMVQFNKVTVLANGMMNLPIDYITRVTKGAR